MNADYDKLTRFCLYRERCTYEVVRKMYELQIPVDRHEKNIAQLKEENYLDEERFVKAYINAKIYLKKWGKKKIMAELSMKKLNKNLVQKYFLEVDDEVYISNLHHLAERKWNSIHKKEEKQKMASMYQYLGSKGYEMDLIKDVITELKKK